MNEKARRTRSSRVVGVDYETVTWESRQAGEADQSRGSFTMNGVPYQAAVPRPIAQARIEVGLDIGAAADDARAAMSRFDAEMAASPELLASPILPTIMLRSESLASSAIEGYWASVEDLGILDAGGPGGAAAASVVRNMEAMRRAIDRGAELDTTSLLDVHRTLMVGDPRAEPGVLRTQPVWIGGVGDYPHGSQFVPPRYQRVSAALEDLWSFARRTDLALLIQVAVAHAQFETIHPFNDGNGRTGRALIHSMLRAADRSLRAVVPISTGLLADTDRYVRALDAYRQGDPSPVVSCFCDATFVGIRAARRLVDDLEEIQERWRDRPVGRAGSAARRLLPVLALRPVVTANLVAEQLGVTWRAANNAIETLIEHGVLFSLGDARRDRMYVATDVTNAYEAFSVRTRRTATWPQGPAWGLD